MNIRQCHSFISDNTTTTTGTMTLSLSHHHLTSFKPLPSCHVTFHAIHNHLLYASTGNIIHAIDTSTFTILDTFTVTKLSSGSVKSVTFINGNIFTAHQDNKIRVWKLTENKRHKHIATLPTFEDRLFRSVLPKNYVKVRRHRKKLWIEHHDAVSGLSVITGQLICSVSWDKHLKIWRTTDNFRCMQSIKAHDDAINCVVVSADGTIYTGSADRKIKLWGKVCEKYGLIATLEKHKSAVNALALNDDGSVLFSGGSDCVILVWGKVHGSNGMVSREVLRGHFKAVLCLVGVCDLLFSGSADRTVRIWQRGCEGKYCCLKVLDGYQKPVRSLVVNRSDATFDSRNGSNVRVFSEGSDKVIRMLTIEGLNLSKSMCDGIIRV